MDFLKSHFLRKFQKKVTVFNDLDKLMVSFIMFKVFQNMFMVNINMFIIEPILLNIICHVCACFIAEIGMCHIKQGLIISVISASN
jgi:hypothetical protein